MSLLPVKVLKKRSKSIYVIIKHSSEIISRQSVNDDLYLHVTRMTPHVQRFDIAREGLSLNAQVLTVKISAVCLV